MRILECIISLKTFNIVVGISTIGGLIFIIISIIISGRHSKTANTMNLISRFYNDIKRLDALPEPYPTPSNTIEKSCNDEFHRNNYDIQLEFISEVATYWKKNLIDKKLLNEHLHDMVQLASAVQSIIQAANPQSTPKRYEIIESNISYLDKQMNLMNKQTRQDLLNSKLEKLYKKKGLA